MLIDRNNKPSESILYIAAQLHDFMLNNKFENIDVQKTYVSITDVFNYTEKTNIPFLKALYALDWLFLIGIIGAVDAEGRLVLI